jgi:hypothetical protein
MKKWIVLLLVFVVILSLVACSGDKPVESTPVQQPTEQTTEEQATEEQVEDQTEDQAEESQGIEEQMKGLMKDLMPNIVIQEPDSIGTVYAVMTFQNVTNMPIVAYEISATLMDTNEATYYASYNTVMPGATSPNFSSFAPESEKLEDINIKELTITVVDSPGSFTTFEYDVKLDRLMGYSYANDEKPPIDVSKLLPTLTILPPDSIGTIYVEAELENTTDLPITGYSLKYLLKDSNEISYLSVYEATLPGEVTSKFSSFGPLSEDMKDIELRVIEVDFAKEDGTTLSIQYDLLLNYGSFFEY